MPNEEWDPSKPLDKDTEEECDLEARARARVKWLQENKYKATAPAGAPPKKRKGVFSRSDD